LIIYGVTITQRYYITFLSFFCGVETVEQRAPPIFGRAAITLGIGPRF